MEEWQTNNFMMIKIVSYSWFCPLKTQKEIFNSLASFCVWILVVSLLMDISVWCQDLADAVSAEELARYLDLKKLDERAYTFEGVSAYDGWVCILWIMNVNPLLLQGDGVSIQLQKRMVRKKFGITEPFWKHVAHGFRVFFFFSILYEVKCNKAKKWKPCFGMSLQDGN